ncbi:MAG: hypothetical protein DHS20C18_34100 [Saprospiraceae bacterium]|nr:MAG: hypothetical protein DHS20C18_34100 [Saprospiraceae bacterium]
MGFFFLLLGGVQNKLYAQTGDIPAPVDVLWPTIEIKIDQLPSDSILNFIFLQVRKHCGEDYDCLYQTYDAIMANLEGRFNLPLAIYLCEEIVEVTKREKDLEAEAEAHWDLCRFHMALGNDRLAIVNIDRALELFERAGNQFGVIKMKMAKLTQSISYRKVEEVLPEMDTLLAESIKNGDTLSTRYLHTLLVEITIEAGYYEAAASHLAALEENLIANPTQDSEFSIILTASLGQADLAMAQNDLAKAEFYYQKTLQFAEQEPDPWVEIHVLHSLGELEWGRGDAVLAKSYLDRAYQKAEHLELNDLLARNFDLRSMIAEAEGRFAEALEFTKKKHFQDEKFKSRSAGFNIQNYYLQKEKEQLAVEKENQELELRLKKSQLHYSFIILVLAVTLAMGFLLAFISLRKRKNELVSQNILIQQQADQLANLDAAKSRFFANISHELRTPLSLILGPIRTLLKESHFSEKHTKLLQMVNQSGKQLNWLVNEILDLQKLEMGKMELKVTPTELSVFFSTYAAQFESLAHRKQIDFSFEIEVGSGVIANIDTEKCRQIVYNLLSNAFKFTPEGGRIEAVVSVDNSMLRLSVQDSGSGIHPDDLQHLFDRFFQTTRPEKPVEGGTGIGLALCREYAQLFGGEIKVTSTLGQGTTFLLAFPIDLVDHPSQATSGKAEILDTLQEGNLPRAMGSTEDQLFALGLGKTKKSVSAKTSHTQKPTILVVEDNHNLQDYIRMILEEKYQVITAENGQIALEKLSSFPLGLDGAGVELILSDLMMPVMDGYQLLEKLKSATATRHLPVIMLTARAETKDKLKALRIGVDDYLLKPFDEEELLVRIENLLKNKAARNKEFLTETQKEDAVPALSKPDQEWLEIFEDYVQKNLSADILNIPTLASEFAMSESTLLRQLKRLTGLSPLQYLLEVRLSEARQLLENRIHNSISKVASEVGYSDVRSFSRSFKKRFGKLPSEIISN